MHAESTSVILHTSPTIAVSAVYNTPNLSLGIQVLIPTTILWCDFNAKHCRITNNNGRTLHTYIQHDSDTHILASMEPACTSAHINHSLDIFHITNHEYWTLPTATYTITEGYSDQYSIVIDTDLHPDHIPSTERLLLFNRAYHPALYSLYILARTFTRKNQPLPSIDTSTGATTSMLSLMLYLNPALLNSRPIFPLLHTFLLSSRRP